MTFWFIAKPKIDHRHKLSRCSGYSTLLRWISTHSRRLWVIFSELPEFSSAVLSLVPGLTKHLALWFREEHAATEGRIQDLAVFFHVVYNILIYFVPQEFNCIVELHIYCESN